MVILDLLRKLEGNEGEKANNMMNKKEKVLKKKLRGNLKC